MFEHSEKVHVIVDPYQISWQKLKETVPFLIDIIYIFDFDWNLI